MNNAWSVEIARIFALLFSTILFGVVSGYWIISVVIHSTIYISWIALQLKQFEQWISHGAQKHFAPDSSGVWQLLIQHIYRSQRSTKDRRNHLKKVATHYHAVMSALPDATVVLNERREIEWANKSSETLLGLDLVHDIGQRLDSIFRDLQLQKLFDEEKMKSSIDIRSPVSETVTLTLTRTSFGEDKTLIIARDISQRIALQQLRKAFVANASHELRTPLTVISGYLEMIAEEQNLPRDIQNCVDSARKQSNRMERILNDLLVLSKLEERNTSQYLRDAINIHSILEKIISDFEVSNLGSKHTFILESNIELYLKISEKNFFSLTQNLLSNAAKYSPEGSIIKICWDLNTDSYACLSISDHGEGIEAEQLERITQRFYRIDRKREKSVSGTGLGLSIVKHILDNADGYLDIQSIVSEGSTFTACFPKNYTAITK